MGLRVLTVVEFRNVFAAWLFACAACFAPRVAQAQWATVPQAPAASPVERTFSSDMAEVWDAFTYTLGSPGRWDSGDWVTAGLITGGVAASTLFEEDLRNAIQGSRGKFGDVLERVGFWYGTPYVTVPASLITYGAGVAFGSDGVRDTGMMMMDVLLFVGLVQQPARMIAGRARPELGEGHFSFKPFTTANERASFISGHAWSAFGISNIVARQIDQGWAYATFFSLAGIAGWSRLYSDKHWLSDVLAGSILGYLTSTTVWKWFEEQRLGPDLRAVSPARWVTFSFRF
jgi:membrane-associated phospholipid phosphatase